MIGSLSRRPLSEDCACEAPDDLPQATGEDGRQTSDGSPIKVELVHACSGKIFPFFTPLAERSGPG